MKTGKNVIPVMLALTIFAFSASFIYFKYYAGQNRIKHVLLISIDTCRADYLSCYGYKEKTTPTIDSVAAQGTLFQHVFSPVPLTLPAHSSMLTGTIPAFHGVHHNINYKLGRSRLTLAEILHSNGFKTGAIVSSIILDKKFGLNQGFDDYLGKFAPAFKGDTHAEQKGDSTTKLACDWLSKNAHEKFFLFLHYYDPHNPYQAPQAFADRFAHSPYAAEIAFTDYCIGRVIEQLKDLGIFDSTLLIITGDHGEMLGEHGEQTHSYYIYQSALTVPLIIRLPGGHTPATISDPISLIDITPTVLALLDLPIPEPVQGRSLRDYCKGEPQTIEPEYIYCESMTPTEYGCNPLLGVINWPWKYIYTTRDELYNLEKDPAEKHNLAQTNATRCKILLNRLKFIIDESKPGSSPDNTLQLDQVSIRQLHSLGYVGSDVQESFVLDKNKPDPKDYIHIHEQKRILLGALAAQKYTEANQLCTIMLQEHPEIPFLHDIAGQIAMATKRYPQVIVHYRNYLRFKPNDYRAQNNIATAYQQTGQTAEAVRHWRKALELNPDYFTAHDNLAKTFYLQGKVESAIPHWIEAVRIEPDNSELLNNLAWIMSSSPQAKLRNPLQAVSYACRACELSKYQNPVYIDTLSVAYASNGQFALAIQTARRALEIAEKTHRAGLAERIRNRIATFERKQPYYDSRTDNMQHD